MTRCLHNNSRHLWPRILGVFSVCIILMLTLGDKADAAEPGPVISLVIDGRGVSADVQPIQRNGRMLVPIRVIAEQTGAQVQYDGAIRQVVVSKQGKRIVIPIDQSAAYVDGKRVTLDVPATIVKKRTLVPIRFVSESLGYQVDWNAASKVAMVWTKKQTASASAKDTSNPYIVQEGDSLFLIAKRHNTSIENLKKNNQLTSDALLAGQLLYLTNQAKPAAYSPKKTAGNQQLLRDDFVFPLAAENEYEPYVDSFGSNREWTESGNGSVRSHEGIDIMAPTGTPVYSVSSGTINRIGWNTYGGWRINITDAGGAYKMYYAHLSAFVPGIKVGHKVSTGQMIGFVGDSGYGAPGTTGMFSPHLHFGLYQASSGKAIDAYNYLRYWEQNKVNHSN